MESDDYKTLASRINVASWLAEERREYADHKYANDSQPRHRAILDMRNFGLDENGEWWVFITNYLKRAQLLGVDTPAGRQALGKLVVTLLHCFETSVFVYGQPPKPGVPSGTVEEWERSRG